MVYQSAVCTVYPMITTSNLLASNPCASALGTSFLAPPVGAQSDHPKVCIVTSRVGSYLLARADQQEYNFSHQERQQSFRTGVMQTVIFV